MALIQFSSVAAGPFVMFKETVEEIFKTISEPFSPKGAWGAEDLSDVLRRLEAAEVRDKAEARRREEELEAMSRASFCFDPAMKGREEELAKLIKENEARINFYQRVVPLKSMIQRAIKHKKPVMWEMMGG